MAQKPWGVWLQRPSSTSALSVEKSPLIHRGYTLRSPVDAWNGKTNEPYIYICMWKWKLLNRVRLYTAHGILQARTLEWIAFPFSRGSFQPSDGIHISYISCTGGQMLSTSTTWEAIFCQYWAQMSPAKSSLSQIPHPKQWPPTRTGCNFSVSSLLPCYLLLTFLSFHSFRH